MASWEKIGLAPGDRPGLARVDKPGLDPQQHKQLMYNLRHSTKNQRVKTVAIMERRNCFIIDILKMYCKM